MKGFSAATDCYSYDSESGISSNSSVNGNILKDLEFDFSDEGSEASHLNPVESKSSFSSSDNADTKFWDNGDPMSIEMPRLDTSTKCEQHRNEIRYLCNKCTVKVCKLCVQRDHSNCPIEPLPSFVRKLSEAVLKEDRSEIKMLKAKVIQGRKMFMNKTESIRMDVINAANRLLLEVEKKRDDFLHKLKLIEQLKIDSWNSQVKLCDRAMKKLMNHQRHPNVVTFGDINTLRRKVFRNIENDLDFIEDGIIDFVPEHRRDFSLGKIRTSASPKNSVVMIPENSYVNEFNSCTVLIRDQLDETVHSLDYTVTATLHDKDNYYTHLIIKNLNSGLFKILYFPRTVGKFTLRVYLNCLPVGNSPYDVWVKQATSKTDSFTSVIIGDRYLSRPWGVCTDFEGRLYVTDRDSHSVKIFQEDGTFLLAFGCEGTAPGELLRPTGIAADRVKRRLLVADKENHRIQIFTYDGLYVSHFGRKGNEDGFLFYPWDVAVDHNSVIAVSDSRNRRIQLFNADGVYIKKVSFQGSPFRDIELPRGVAYTPSGLLLVTDFNKHQVIRINNNLQTIEIFGSKGSSPAQFYRPQCIDVDKHGRFAVADCKNHRIQVFQKKGKICSIFGTLGSKPGELDSPQGICFLPRGRIAVAELGNNRIQIFKIPDEKYTLQPCL